MPIWIRVSDQTYVGCWQHFFCDRATTLVTCSPEDGFRADHRASVLAEAWLAEPRADWGGL